MCAYEHDPPNVRVPAKDMQLNVTLRNLKSKRVPSCYNSVTQHLSIFAKSGKVTAMWIDLATNSCECCSVQHPNMHIGSYLQTEWAAVENNTPYFAVERNSCSLVKYAAMFEEIFSNTLKTEVKVPSETAATTNRRTRRRPFEEKYPRTHDHVQTSPRCIPTRKTNLFYPLTIH